MEIGTALCVRGQPADAHDGLRLTPEELAAQDERELAIAECKAELAGYPLYSEDARSSDDSERRNAADDENDHVSFEMAGHRTQDQSFYGDCFYSTPK
eukprot:5897329-Pleurochrysis_carterae.AAC.1